MLKKKSFVFLVLHSFCVYLQSEQYRNRGRESPEFLNTPARTAKQNITYMIDAQYIKEAAENLLTDDRLFIVDASVSPACEIEVQLDSDASVSVDDCVALSRALEALLEESGQDFSLTVCSAGIGQPLKLLRQYRKLIGHPVEVLLCSGTRILATLTDATDERITLEYSEKVAVEGKKRKQEVSVVRTYPLSEVKYTREYLDVK